MSLDIEEIRKILPHRYPFLLVDRVLELEPGRLAIGRKNVTANEPFFQGHWPHRSVMPGVLILEALAQVGSVMMLTMPEHRGSTGYFTGIDKARFRQQVVPGDTVELRTELKRTRGHFGIVSAQASVDGQVVAEAELMFALIADSDGASSEAAISVDTEA
ncbi:MAG TPA: 3-hydroxyacyl-ACP dehydratase FabZ [Armatimonadota bacterium]